MARIYLAHPKAKQQAGGLGWNGAEWKPRENLGKFIIDLTKDKTYLSSEQYTFEIEKVYSQSFILKYELKDKENNLNWREAFLTIEYFGRREMHYMISPLVDKNKVLEDTNIDLTRYGYNN